MTLAHLKTNIIKLSIPTKNVCRTLLHETFDDFQLKSACSKSKINTTEKDVNYVQG